MAGTLAVSPFSFDIWMPRYVVVAIQLPKLNPVVTVLILAIVHSFSWQWEDLVTNKARKMSAIRLEKLTTQSTAKAK